MQFQGSVTRINTQRLSFSVARPQIPKHQVVWTRIWIIAQSVNTPPCTNPVARLHMVGLHAVGVSCCERLLGSEVSRLPIGNCVQLIKIIFEDSGHCIFPTLYV